MAPDLKVAHDLRVVADLVWVAKGVVAAKVAVVASVADVAWEVVVAVAAAAGKVAGKVVAKEVVAKEVVAADVLVDLLPPIQRTNHRLKNQRKLPLQVPRRQKPQQSIQRMILQERFAPWLQTSQRLPPDQLL
jgi:hypothetical protein